MIEVAAVKKIIYKKIISIKYKKNLRYKEKSLLMKQKKKYKIFIIRKLHNLNKI